MRKLVGSFNLKVFFFASFTFFFLTSCVNEKEKMIQSFEQLHEHVKSGNLSAYYDYMDSNSQKFIDALVDPENMVSEKIKNLGEEYQLETWCAYYWKNNSTHVQKFPNTESFFHFVVQEETPLFYYNQDYFLVKEKSRIRNNENFIVIGRDDVGRREISWLPYTNESGVYKLNLIELLQQNEYYHQRSALQAIQEYEPETTQAEWLEQTVNFVYSQPPLDRTYEMNDYNKSQRRSE